MIHLNNIDDQCKPVSTFTILTYNCLASNLAAPEYFPKTDPDHLDFSYRSKLFEHELKLFNADIVCLQEMHIDDFKQWLSPFLFHLGYDQGTFAERGGTSAKDGVVTFFKRDKFKLIAQHQISYFDKAKAQFPKEASLAAYNTALFCLLQIQQNETNESDKEEQQFWICNTHINWNHNLPATQFFQIRTLLSELTQLNKKTPNDPFVIVGDFNSAPHSIVHDYMRNGFLTDTADYYSKVYDIYLPLFDRDSTKTIKYLTESHVYRNTLESAYNEKTFVMPFTTRVVHNYCGIIDYIYYQPDHMRPRRLLNVLYNDDERALHKSFTLPNEQHPSDHLPLMAELDLFSYSDQNKMKE